MGYKFFAMLFIFTLGLLCFSLGFLIMIILNGPV